MAARRGRFPAKPIWRRVSVSRRARRARRSTRWPQTTSSCVARERGHSSLRIPKRRPRCSDSCASAATTATTSIRQAACSTCGAARRRPKSRGRSSCKAATPVIIGAPRARILRRAGGARRDRAAGGAVSRADARTRRSLSRLDVQLVRNRSSACACCGRRKGSGDRCRCADRALSARCAPASRCSRSSG